MKRWFCLILAAVMCLTMCTAAVADGQTVVEIATAADFLSIRNDMSATYILKNDIVFTETDYQPGGILENGFLPFGLSKQYDAQKGYYYAVTDFTGTLDGDGHRVSGLRIETTSTDQLKNNYAGLFAETAGTVKKLAVDVEVCFVSEEKNVFNTFLVGTIAARNVSGGSIEQCRVIGTVYAKTGAVVQIGGIVGENGGNITDCQSVVDITVGNTQNNMRAGGIVGYTKSSSVVERCFSSGSLQTTQPFGADNLYVGALIGYNNGAVYNGYALECVKKLLGRDSATAAQRAKNIRSLLSDEQAEIADNFAAFDFTDVWTMGETSPELKLFAHQHSFGDWTETVGNCVCSSKKERICSSCGQRERVYTGFGAHFFDDGTVVTAPTCATTGQLQQTCALCGTVQKTEIKRLPMFSLQLESTDIDLQPSGSYQLGWQSTLSVANDPGDIDWLITEYGIIYATSEQTLLTYMERIAAGLDTDDLKVSVRPAVSSYVGITKLYRYTNFTLTGVAPNKERYAVAYIRYELDGEEFEDYSAPAYASTK